MIASKEIAVDAGVSSSKLLCSNFLAERSESSQRQRWPRQKKLAMLRFEHTNFIKDNMAGSFALKYFLFIDFSE